MLVNGSNASLGIPVEQGLINGFMAVHQRLPLGIGGSGQNIFNGGLAETGDRFLQNGKKTICTALDERFVKSRIQRDPLMAGGLAHGFHQLMQRLQGLNPLGLGGGGGAIGRLHS